LQEAFRLLDKNGNGYIGALELQFLCKKWGEDLTLEEVDKMVSEALIGYDGKIFYDGLLKILITQ
jgi:calmodulin